MKEKLPKIYVNKIEKKLNNNEQIYNTMSKSEEKISEKKDKEQSINIKINKIFNTRKYVYKIPVKIKMKETDNEIKTRIIGKTKKHLITIDNELIEIEKIKDIEISEK